MERAINFLDCKLLFRGMFLTSLHNTSYNKNISQDIKDDLFTTYLRNETYVTKSSSDTYHVYAMLKVSMNSISQNENSQL